MHNIHCRLLFGSTQNEYNLGLIFHMSFSNWSELAEFHLGTMPWGEEIITYECTSHSSNITTMRMICRLEVIF